MYSNRHLASLAHRASMIRAAHPDRCSAPHPWRAALAGFPISLFPTPSKKASINDPRQRGAPRYGRSNRWHRHHSFRSGVSCPGRQVKERADLCHATEMHLRGRARKSPEAEIARLRKQLDEHFGSDGPARLRGLIYCVRHRKRSGYEAEVIAERAKLTLDRVRQVLGGDCTRVSWDAVAAVLLALDAGNAHLSVAGELYEEITATGSRPGSGRGDRPGGLRPGALNWPDGLPAALAARWLIPWRTGPGAATFRLDLPSPSRAGSRREDADVPVASRRHE